MFSAIAQFAWYQLLKSKHDGSNISKCVFRIVLLYSRVGGLAHSEAKQTANFVVRRFVEAGVRCSLVTNFDSFYRSGPTVSVLLLSLHEFSEMSGCMEELASSKFCNIVSFFVSTWTDGRPHPDAADFFSLIDEYKNDHRVPADFFNELSGAFVVGYGSRTYPSNTFCAPALDLQRHLGMMGCKLMTAPVQLSDDEDHEESFSEWLEVFSNFCLSQSASRIKPTADAEEKRCPCCSSHIMPLCDSCDATCGAIDEKPASSSDCDEQSKTAGVACSDEDEVDMEEVVDVSGEPKAMVSSKHRTVLEKEGYKIVGTHSAVKLCRWTKTHLRGRGGCYKHTFYGISSQKCMEATPSLACANKCVFCWRHHKNPVGTSWKWLMDEPQAIVDGWLEHHSKMIKTLRGVPGVTPEKFSDANVAHCALSLVGEPIMYPKIIQIIRLLHQQNISTFLVTNGQFPEAIRALECCTQLYVSIDAATKDALKVVDRPLFTDFWERFLESLDAIRSKQFLRTVYRLTLVKSYNMGISRDETLNSVDDVSVDSSTEAARYAALILRGMPTFVEVKAVTYSGNSGSVDPLTMKNIPWHREVLAFSEAIVAANSEVASKYSVAAEHAHSCSVLICRNDMQDTEGRWLTWIDYDRFFELWKHQMEDPSFNFLPRDFALPMPRWAEKGAAEAGFDPEETRCYPKGKMHRAMKASATAPQ